MRAPNYIVDTSYNRRTLLVLTSGCVLAGLWPASVHRLAYSRRSPFSYCFAMKSKYTLLSTPASDSVTAHKPSKGPNKHPGVPHTSLDLRLLKSGRGWTFKAVPS